jgi:alkaline phosphatase D
MGAARFDHYRQRQLALSRRGFLGLSAGVVLAGCLGDDGGGSSASEIGADTVARGRPTTTLPPVPALTTDPFTLGVASGDPTHDGVVLWTRLAPDPLTPGGGMDPVDAPVRWMVGTDDALRKVVAEGTFVTGPDVGHAVHVVVEKLKHDTPYWYRFAIGDHETPIARTRTFPRPSHKPDHLRFAFASCQNFRDGYYTAWGDVATDDDLDLVVFLGDYIYESGLAGRVRAHDIPEVVTLDEYRSRYALYRSDPMLRAAHALAPWLVTWDDHEVDNNYQGVTAELTSATPDPQQFLARRAAAYRAWWEHMPTRLAPPRGPDLAIHRRSDFGRLARFHVLDTRQYRSDQPCSPTDIGPICDAALADDFTLLGAQQEAWLADGLRSSDATWNVLAQQIVFSQLRFGVGAEAIVNLDQWDGYPGSRRRVLDVLGEPGVSNPVVITGDIHTSGVSDLKGDYDDPDGAVLGAEFVGTSISSGAPDILVSVVPVALQLNPHVRWADAARRGWVRCEVTPDAWTAEYRLVDDATVEGSPVQTATRWVLEPGRPVEQA